MLYDNADDLAQGNGPDVLMRRLVLGALWQGGWALGESRGLDVLMHRLALGALWPPAVLLECSCVRRCLNAPFGARCFRTLRPLSKP